MDLQLAGKRVLVTGSNSGIGAGIARVFANEGASVVVHGRNPDRTRTVAEQLASVATCVAVTGDLSTAEGCAKVASEVQERLGGIDILVNNAGGKTTEGNPEWMDIPWSNWASTYEQNVGAAVRMIHHFLPGMKSRKWGRIIQIASASATQPEPVLGEYQAAKAALVSITASLAKAMTNTGITVNTVSPGTILTENIGEWLSVVAEQKGWEPDWENVERRFTSELIPLCVDQLGRPEDIGRVVALIASPLSSYITGANYRVDGGQCRSIN